jgi:hypothetical protein
LRQIHPAFTRTSTIKAPSKRASSANPSSSPLSVRCTQALFFFLFDLHLLPRFSRDLHLCPLHHSLDSCNTLHLHCTTSSCLHSSPSLCSFSPQSHLSTPTVLLPALPARTGSRLKDLLSSTVLLAILAFPLKLLKFVFSSSSICYC